jgi:hypothetical protein
LPPQIEYFRVSPDSINAGECVALEWGAVNGAYEAVIEPEIGGVGTPGSTDICLTETTTFTLSATGPGGEATASVKVAVRAQLADLLIESIEFVPSPPVQGQNNQVWITIRNAGSGAAGPFDWEWQPGTEAPIRRRLTNGLNGGQTTVETIVWQPAEWQENLITIARVDVGSEVEELDEDNNEREASTPVSQPVLGDLELQEFALPLDDQAILRVSNPGGRIIEPWFEYEIYEDGVLADSGTFETPPIGSMVYWIDYILVGERTVEVVVDPADLVVESDEENNRLVLTCSSESRSCW